MPPKPPKPPPGKATYSSSAGTPNQTLYCSNLPDKLQKQDLRRSLYTLFSTYGPILDIIALKTAKMRGQAHIVFRDVQASMAAMRAFQGFEFFGKEIKIAYGKGKSDTIAKLDGTFKMPVTNAPVPSSSEIQKSVFDAPPSAATTGATRAAPNATADVSMTDRDKASQGVKRTRDDEEEAEDSDVPMEEDDDAMDESDSD